MIQLHVYTIQKNLTFLLSSWDIGGSGAFCQNPDHAPESSDKHKAQDHWPVILGIIPLLAWEIHRHSGKIFPSKVKQTDLWILRDSHFAHLVLTKSNHTFLLLTHSGWLSPRNRILWRLMPFSGFVVLWGHKQTGVTGIFIFQNRHFQAYKTHIWLLLTLLVFLSGTQTLLLCTHQIPFHNVTKTLEPTPLFARWWPKKGRILRTLEIHKI